MKILFSPCHYVYDEFYYGSELSWAFYIADLISKQSKNKGSVVITGFSRILNKKEYKIIEIQPENKELDNGIKNSIVFLLKYFWETWKILRKQRFDLIHHVLPFAINKTFDLNFIFKYHGCPLVIGPIQSPLNKPGNIFGIVLLDKLLNSILYHLSNFTLKRADAIIAINEYTRQLLVGNGINETKIFVVPSGVKKDNFNSKVPKFMMGNTINLLVVSYLVKRKAVHLIIEAINEIVKQNENIHLTIVGDGPEKKNLENLVEEMALSRFITFEGFVENFKIQEYYNKANVFLSMSKAESWGQMYLEAMACSLPVISSKNVGSESIIKESFGFLVDQGDYSAMAEKILFFVNNPAKIKEFGLNARKEVEQKYDWETVIIPKYIKIYEEVLSNNSKA